MDTLSLIDARLRHQLGLINGERMIAGKSEVRLDIDASERGIMPIEDWYYRFRVELRFEPLLTVRVSKKGGVFYFDVDGSKVDSDVYMVTKHPPRYNKTDTFWLADELDTPLGAIETHMRDRLS